MCAPLRSAILVLILLGCSSSPWIPRLQRYDASIELSTMPAGVQLSSAEVHGIEPARAELMATNQFATGLAALLPAADDCFRLTRHSQSLRVTWSRMLCGESPPAAILPTMSSRMVVAYGSTRRRPASIVIFDRFGVVCRVQRPSIEASPWLMTGLPRGAVAIANRVMGGTQLTVLGQRCEVLSAQSSVSPPTVLAFGHNQVLLGGPTSPSASTLVAFDGTLKPTFRTELPGRVGLGAPGPGDDWVVLATVGANTPVCGSSLSGRKTAHVILLGNKLACARSLVAEPAGDFLLPQHSVWNGRHFLRFAVDAPTGPVRYSVLSWNVE